MWSGARSWVAFFIDSSDSLWEGREERGGEGRGKREDNDRQQSEARLYFHSLGVRIAPLGALIPFLVLAIEATVMASRYRWEGGSRKDSLLKALELMEGGDCGSGEL
jgi:hypothetical protein